MEQFEREFFVYRLVAGYHRVKIGDRVLKVVNPTIDILYEAQETYVETIEKAAEYEIATDKDIDSLLRERQLWSDKDEEELKVILPKHIEYWKVEIYNHFDNERERKRLMVHLQAARQGINDLFNRKHAFDQFTQHGLATFARWQRVIELSTFDENGKLYDWSDTSINNILDFISRGAMTEEMIRDVCRNDPWKSMWSAGKKTGSLFRTPSTELSDEQRRVVNWSGLYDNVSEHEDHPSEEVVAHDDAFDGWLILKHRENDKNRKENAFKKKKGVSAMDAPEVFLVMDKEKDDPEKFRQTVYGMNDPTSRMIVSSRLHTIQKLGECKDGDFADVQRSVNRGVGQMIKDRSSRR